MKTLNHNHYHSNIRRLCPLINKKIIIYFNTNPLNQFTEHGSNIELLRKFAKQLKVVAEFQIMFMANIPDRSLKFLLR
jgi:hypothetical protein